METLEILFEDFLQTSRLDTFEQVKAYQLNNLICLMNFLI